MAIAHVQTTEITNTGGLANSATITVAAGSLLIVEFAYLNSTGTVTVTDNQSGVWVEDATKINNADVPNFRVSLVSCVNAAGGSTQITVTPTGSGTWRAKIREFSGVQTTAGYLDAASTNTEDTTDDPTATPSPGLTIPAGALVVTTWGFDRSPSPSGPTGWTGAAFASGDAYSSYKIFAGSGSGERGLIAADPTHYIATMGVYKAAAGGGGGTVANPITGRGGAAAQILA